MVLSRVRIALVIGSIILIAAIILARGNRAPDPQNIVAWSGSGTLLQTINATSPQLSSEIGGTYTGGVALDTSRLAFLENASGSVSHDEEFLSILAQLTNTPRPFASDSSSTAAADAIRDAFAMVPQFNTFSSASSESTVRTPAQEAIYVYGNAAGSIIKAYEASHQNAVQVIAAQSTDRSSVQKAQALRDLGAAISKIGTDMKKMRDVPADAVEAHTQFANRYIRAGELLAKMADASGDEAYIAAINAYNASVSALIEQHIALATYFSLAGVHFSSSDGGSVFTFGGFGSF